MMELLLEIKLTVKYIYKCKKKKNQQQSRERCRCTSSLLQYCPFIVLHCPAWSSACTPSPWGFTQETEKFQIQARYTKSTLFFSPPQDRPCVSWPDSRSARHCVRQPGECQPPGSAGGQVCVHLSATRAANTPWVT